MLLYCFLFGEKNPVLNSAPAEIEKLMLRGSNSRSPTEVPKMTKQIRRPERFCKREHTESSHPGREDDFGARAAARSNQAPHPPHRPASYGLSRPPALEWYLTARRGTGHEIRAATGRSGGGKAGDDAGGSVGHLLPQPPRRRPHQPPLP